MSATWSASTQPVLFAGQNYAQRMPISMATAPGIMISGTGVLASVSLFVLLHISSLLIGLVLLTSLILSGLTGLSGLVRLTIGLEL